MTEAEILETVTNFLDLTLSSLSIYLTVVSAYLVVAFVAGDRLSTAQLIIINVLYTVASTMMTFSTVYYFTKAFDFRNELLILRPDDKYISEHGLAIGTTMYAVLLLSGIIASLYFMVSTRKQSKIDT